jgi:hypothetical protein
MSASTDSISWFEIPVTEIERAINFYSTVVGDKLEMMEFGPMKMFPAKNKGDVHGALVQGEGFIPSDKGSLIYLNGGDDLATPLGRVAAAGGTVLQDKMSIGEHGHIALFKDTEGNKVGFLEHEIDLGILLKAGLRTGLFLFFAIKNQSVLA